MSVYSNSHKSVFNEKKITKCANRVRWNRKQEEAVTRFTISSCTARFWIYCAYLQYQFPTLVYFKNLKEIDNIFGSTFSRSLQATRYLFSKELNLLRATTLQSFRRCFQVSGYSSYRRNPGISDKTRLVRWLTLSCSQARQQSHIIFKAHAMIANVFQSFDCVRAC